MFGTCAGLANAKGLDSACSITFKYGMKRDFNAYLASLGPGAPFRTLTQVRQYNLANRPRNAIRYNQEHLDISDEMDLAADRARWQADRNKDIFLAATHGIDEIMARQSLDALLFPGPSSAGIARQGRAPDGDRAVRLRAERAGGSGSAGRLQREGSALRRGLHRHGVHGAAVD